MGLFIELTQTELKDVIETYHLGRLHASTGVPQGSINTNYRLETSQGRFFLRHTSVRSVSDLEFESRLLQHLVGNAFPAPVLVSTRDGRPCMPLRGGYVSIFHFLTGEELTRSSFDSVRAERLGAELGKMHRLTQSFMGTRENPYGPNTVVDWLHELAQNTNEELRRIAEELKTSLNVARSSQNSGLASRGVIHADLFMDNVKWIGDRVGAFFDFEMACFDAYMLDVAITLNAWCFDHDEYQTELCRSFMRGYRDERVITADEAEGLFAYALFGAIRYTVSRIRDFHLSPLPPEKLSKKSFRTYLSRTRQLMQMGPQRFREKVGL